MKSCHANTGTLSQRVSLRELDFKTVGAETDDTRFGSARFNHAVILIISCCTNGCRSKMLLPLYTALSGIAKITARNSTKHLRFKAFARNQVRYWSSIYKHGNFQVPRRFKSIKLHQLIFPVPLTPGGLLIQNRSNFILSRLDDRDFRYVNEVKVEVITLFYWRCLRFQSIGLTTIAAP